MNSIFDKVILAETLLKAINFINEDLIMPVDVAGTMVMVNCLLLLKMRW